MCYMNFFVAFSFVFTFFLSLYNAVSLIVHILFGIVNLLNFIIICAYWCRSPSVIIMSINHRLLCDFFLRIPICVSISIKTTIISCYLIHNTSNVHSNLGSNTKTACYIKALTLQQSIMFH